MHALEKGGRGGVGVGVDLLGVQSRGAGHFRPSPYVVSCFDVMQQ